MEATGYPRRRNDNPNTEQAISHQKLVSDAINEHPNAQMGEIYSLAMKNLVETEAPAFNEYFCVYYHNIKPFEYTSLPYERIIKPSMLSKQSGRGGYCSDG